uniref:Uncharacterized protein n=1 Tax=Romanomermis culicivorax TaxID=13658 RepID=A0A915HZC9_ROMCU
MINFRCDANNALSKIVTLAMQQQKYLEEYKIEIEDIKAQKKELLKLKVSKAENILRPTSSYAQSQKLSKNRNIASEKKSQISF